MNIEYTYINGKVIICDENDNKTQRDYYDNLDEVLVQENIIEFMEEKIQNLETESQLSNKKNRRRYIPVAFPMTLFMTTIGTPTMYNLFTDGANVDTIFGTISIALAAGITMTLTFLPFGSGVELIMHNEYKNSLRNENGINSELDFLKAQIVKEKEYLDSLKQDQTRDKENTDFRTVKVDDLQQLIVLRDFLYLYYDLGFNGDKYYKYYQDGKLDKKLEKYYSDTGIQLAKEYIEEKGPSLVLRRK